MDPEVAGQTPYQLGHRSSYLESDKNTDVNDYHRQEKQTTAKLIIYYFLSILLAAMTSLNQNTIPS